MNKSLSTDSDGDDVFARICDAIADKGYIVLKDGFSESLLTELLTNLTRLDHEHFKPAGIGRAGDFHHDTLVRKDHIFWLDKSMVFATPYFRWAEQLRARLNQRLFIGLFDYESMLAHYPEGAFYQRHMDAFDKTSNRKLTTILYLNPNWDPADGGQLLIYPKGGDVAIETVVPTLGTLVIFLSEEFPHEVLPAARSRFSLTGWFRVNQG